MITPELHAEIRRLYFGEHWKVGTIAATLGVHHDTVSVVIAHDTQALRRGRTLADPFLPFMRDTLAQYPRLRATRLFEMVRARGYPGSVVQLRRVVRTLRPPVTPTVYRRLSTLPAEEAQVDWGAFGAIRIGQKKRPTHRGVTAFVGTPRSRCARTALRAATALFVAPLLIDSVVRKRTPLHDPIRLGNWMRFAPKPAHIWQALTRPSGPRGAKKPTGRQFDPAQERMERKQSARRR